MLSMGRVPKHPAGHAPSTRCRVRMHGRRQLRHSHFLKRRRVAAFRAETELGRRQKDVCIRSTNKRQGCCALVNTSGSNINARCRAGEAKPPRRPPRRRRRSPTSAPHPARPNPRLVEWRHATPRRQKRCSYLFHRHESRTQRRGSCPVDQRRRRFSRAPPRRDRCHCGSECAAERWPWWWLGGCCCEV